MCFVLVVVAMHGAGRGKTSLRAEHDSSGTTLLPDRRSGALVVASLVLVTLSLGIITVALPLGVIDVPMSAGMRTFSPFVAGFGAIVGAVGLIVGWRRGGIGYVHLGGEGIEIANIAYTESVSWQDITDVRDTAETKKTRRAIVLVLRDGHEKLIDGADIYVPGGAALYWMVRHYWKFPGDRAELTDGTALARIRDGDFVAD
ncbi:hypothetical protein [Mycolicibacterium sp. F2034L]|uniref:hypothetical protein n=1 Tax=Mycolicibacterium sp. F2034L TaxID=2926422 RepID=UPI001FF54418|nr:hypothetical protein [Mycolicibacterium sp. F2034L]MCK0177605.1 hypothetical protein [Mycolicibacterium sp. F2034L]